MTILARGEAALREIQSQYPNQVQILAGDLSDFALAEKAVNVTITQFGRLDGLVINHGTLPPVTNIQDSEIDAWKHNFDVNFFSGVAFVCLR